MRVALLLAVLASLLVAGCAQTSGGDDGTSGDMDDGDDGSDGMDGMEDGDDGSDGMDAGETFTVRVRDFEFDPPMLEIPAGSTVRWVVDEGFHSVTADDGSFDSGTGIQEYSQTFGETGDNAYHCSVHPAMQGTIRVV